MNIRMIAVPLLCATQVALADEPARPPTDTRGAVTPPAASVPAAPGQRQAGMRRLPRGDLRHCLELDDDKAVIRCAEGRR